MFVHLVARMLPGHAWLLTGASPAWLWSRLRAGSPQALGAVFMPNHLHMVIETEDPAATHRRLIRTLTWHRRSFSPRCRCWEQVPPPEPIVGLRKLRRQLRYVALNPCRAGLAPDPMAWLWSTHRDAIGAVADPWPPDEGLAPFVAGSVEGWHRYVSSDPSVSPVGSPLPCPAEPASIPTYPLGRIRRAAAAAFRAGLFEVSRRGPARQVFVQLATEQGWRDTGHLAEACGASLWTVRRLRRGSAGPGLAASRLCLGDDRLLQPHRLLLVSANRVSGLPQSA